MAQAAARRARRERAAGPVAVALAVGLALVGTTAGCARSAADATAGDEPAQALANSGTADPTAAPELLALYRTALAAAGFTEVTSQTSDSDLAVDVTFVRSGGDELVSIGVLDIDGARTVTIGGRVRTGD